MDIDKKKLNTHGKNVLKVAFKRCTGRKPPKSIKKTLKEFKKVKVNFIDSGEEQWNKAIGFTLIDSEDGIYLSPATCDNDFIEEVQDSIGALDTELTSYYDMDGRQLLIEITEIAKSTIGSSVAEEEEEDLW